MLSQVFFILKCAELLVVIYSTLTSVLHLCVFTLWLIENVCWVLKVKKVREFEASARAHVIILSEFFSITCVWALELPTCPWTETQSYKSTCMTEEVCIISHDLQASGSVKCYFLLVLFFRARIGAQIGIWLWILDRFLGEKLGAGHSWHQYHRADLEWHTGRPVQEVSLRSTGSYRDPNSLGAQSPCLTQRQDTANQLIGSMLPLWEAASVGSCKVPASILKL